MATPFENTLVGQCLRHFNNWVRNRSEHELDSSGTDQPDLLSALRRWLVEGPGIEIVGGNHDLFVRVVLGACLQQIADPGQFSVRVGQGKPDLAGLPVGHPLFERTELPLVVEKDEDVIWLDPEYFELVQSRRIPKPMRESDD